MDSLLQQARRYQSCWLVLPDTLRLNTKVLEDKETGNGEHMSA